MSVPSLLLATSFRPTVGGMETLLYQTARRLSSPPLVIAPVPAAAPDLAVRAVQVSPRGIAGRLAYRAGWAAHPSLYYTSAFRRATLEVARRSAVMQAGHVWLAPLAWQLARRHGRRFVVYAYGQEVWRGRRPRQGLPGLDALLRGAALRAADRVIVLGRFGASLVADWGVTAERIVRAPFGAEPRPAFPLPARNRLLSVCRLVPRKGVDTVIEALPRLVAVYPDLEYRVVGGGPDAARLQALARRLGVAERVRLLGRVDDAALEAELAGCRLFVQPSRRTAAGELEGLGLVYFEAAARGRAVVAGCSGGEGDAVVDGVTGRLVDGASAGAVAQVVGELLGDAGLLERLGSAGQQRVVERHNWRYAAACIDAMLAELSR
ncbi:MAG: glycosyltransferase family 4 protein [Chloroflexi bacterium]|nr:glycosyltransferase family 4 protein [Chloroflexota bacterium]